MSRVGKQPISIPDGVTVNVSGSEVSVKGPNGQLSGRIPESIGVVIGDGRVVLERPDERKSTRALHGLSRALVANMVKGVMVPFTKELEIQGVGYRAAVQGKKLKLDLGYSHSVLYDIPDGITITCDTALHRHSLMGESNNPSCARDTRSSA